MSGHRHNSGSGQHGAQRHSAQRQQQFPTQASQRGATPQQSQPQGSQQGAHIQQSRPQGSQQGAPTQQSQPQGSQQGAPTQQSQPQGSQQGAHTKQSQPQGSQQGAPAQQSQPQGSQQGAPTQQSQPQGSQQGAPTQQSQPQGSQQVAPTQQSGPQGSQQGARIQQSQPQGSQQGAPTQQSRPQGSQQGAYKQQSQPQGSQQGAHTKQSQPQGSQQGAPKQQSRPQGSQQGAYTQQSQPQGSQQGAHTQQSQPQGSQQGAPTQQSQPQGSQQAARPTLPQYSPQQQSEILAAENFWRAEIRQWFPALHSQTYFVPPLHFNRPSYDVQTVAGQSVLVPQVASDQPHRQRAYVHPTGPPPDPSDPPLPSRVWPPYQAVPPGPLPVVQDNDMRDDRAMQVVCDFIHRLTERMTEEERAMVVLSRLQFRKYLDNQVNPITAAAARLLPRPATLGKGFEQGVLDMLMINGSYSLIVTEVKSVGADQTPPPDKEVTKKVERAIEQLDKSESVLQHLTSDLGPVRITKTLALPFIEAQQLEGILATNQQLLQDMCRCLWVPDTNAPAAVSRCLMADDIRVPASSVWWQRTVTDHGPDASMTEELYERLAARFCGPATTIEVPTLTTPRRTVGLRTLSEGVALAGLTMSLLTLYPEQVDLVNSTKPRVFLWGPPGTGKTIVLILKAIQWGHQGKDVHVVSTWRNSRAATRLIEHQLLATPGVGFTAHPGVSRRLASAQRQSLGADGPLVHTHFYDFQSNKGDVKGAVKELASAARDRELFVIVDECHHSQLFAEFCTLLARPVPNLHLWAANVQRDDVTTANVQSDDVTTNCLVEERLTRPVRCPPAVVHQVARSVLIDDRSVPRYSSNSAIPAATDGPAVRLLPPHWQWSSGYGDTLSPGHTGGVFRPEDCTRCAENIADLLTRELRVGQTGQPLKHCDVIVLCLDPREDLAVVTCLRGRGVPVQVVRRDADESVVRDVALAKRNAVTVTESEVVSGLERWVVVAMGERRGLGEVVDVHYERLVSMSRSTALVVWTGEPLEPDDDDDDDDD